MKHLSVAIIWVCLVGCGVADGVLGDEESDSSGGGGSSADACPESTDLQDPNPEAGQLVFDLEDEIEACDVDAFVVGYEDTLKAKRAGDQFVIDAVPGGEQDLIVTAGAIAVDEDAVELGLIQSDEVRGIRLNGLQILNGARTTKEDLELPLAGSISGRIELEGVSDYSLVLAVIPGTSFSAFTDEDGKFTISNVPVGEHNLKFDKRGYYTGAMEKVEVFEDESTDIGDVKLFLETGSEATLQLVGGKLLDDESFLLTSRDANVNVLPSEGAVLIMKSENSNFENARWQPLVTSLPHEFTDEQKDMPIIQTVYVKMANANGLESPPYTIDATVDVFSAGQAIFRPSFSVSNSTVYPRDGYSLTGITVPSSAKSMDVSFSGGFTGRDRVSPSSSYTSGAIAQDPMNCGPQNAYVRFIDKDGYKSQNEGEALTVYCWEEMDDAAQPTVENIGSGDHYFGFYADLGGSGQFFVAYIASNAGGGGFVYSQKLDDDTWDKRGAWAYSNASTVLAGDKLMWWGGDSMGMRTDTGLTYDIVNETTAATLADGDGTTAPRNYHSGAWDAGNEEMIIWGGIEGIGEVNTGFTYDPDAGAANDRWIATIVDGNTPAARSKHTAVWNDVDGEMIVWGGQLTGAAVANTGGRYTPGVGWDTMTTTDAPAARMEHHALWTGSKMVIFGGDDGTGTKLTTGGIYDPATDSWELFETTDGPADELEKFAIAAAEDKLFIWGGINSFASVQSTGYIYDFADQEWSSTPMIGAPSIGRYNIPAAYDPEDERFFMYSGSDGGATYHDGYYHYPF